MTKEMKELPGKCSCGKELDHRIIEVQEDEKDKNSKTIAWIIWGNCMKCKLAIMMAFFPQEEEPVADVDYMIERNKVADISKERLK
jgi:hypothetical protein